MRAGAERAEVTVEQVVRELKLIGFSDIRKVVSWRNELVTRTEKGEDDEPVMVLMPRVTIVDARQPDRWSWRPQEGSQYALVICPLKEIFFGGTRGGGKADARNC